MFKFIKNNYRKFLCQRRYKKIITQLKLKERLRVIFLVTENSKWCYQSLYDYMNKSDKFEAIVLISVLTSVHNKVDKTRNSLEDNYNFFKLRKINVDYAYSNGNYIDLKEFDPDIVFYEQPWDLPKIHKPINVSKFALTCYCDYGLELVEDKDNYKTNFHYLLYKFFVDNINNISRYKDYIKGASNNCFALGYPKLDVYHENNNIKLENIWLEPQKIKIIYAPHHSFENDGLQFATFKDNGHFMLEFAKLHPETTWVFKPHPRFKFALIKNNIMTEQEVDKYYDEWLKIGKICTQGDYFDIFKTSDLMITDCCSFLGEYLPTLKPIIRLTIQNSMQLNNFGETIVNACYQTFTKQDFINIYDKIIKDKKDYLLEKRLEIASTMLDFNKKSSDKICKEILNEIGEI